MNQEIWKPITCYEGQYEDQFEVSSLGRIRRSDTHEEMKQSVNADNYVQMFNLGGKNPKYPYVHKIVAYTFCPNDNPEHKVIVDHLDYNPRNNRADNLEWVTKSENFRRAKLLRDSFGQRRKIRCVESGKTYNKYQDVVDDLGIRYESVRSAVLYGLKIHGYHFEAVEKDTDEVLW